MILPGFPIPMIQQALPIDYVGGFFSGFNTNNVTVGAHLPGDLIVAFATRNDTTSPPLTPAGFSLHTTAVNNFSGVEYCLALFSRVSDGSVGNVVFTNASLVTALVFRNASGIGGRAPLNTSSNTNTATTTFLSLPSVADGSWVVGSTLFDRIGSDPTGMVRVTGNMAAHSNGPVNAFASRTVSHFNTALQTTMVAEVLLG